MRSSRRWSGCGAFWWSHWELPGSLNDELEWLRYVENDLQERVGEYAQLYRQMRELRGDELQALGEEEALSGEGQEALWAEEEISNRTWEIFCALPEARELLAQEDALATNAGTAAEKKLKKAMQRTCAKTAKNRWNSTGRQSGRRGRRWPHRWERSCPAHRKSGDALGRAFEAGTGVL